MSGKAYLELGYLCNNFCKHCFVPRTEKPFDLTTEQAKEAILAAKRKCFDAIAFTGGEPTLRRDIGILAEYARSVGFEIVELQTNGRLMSYDHIARWIAGIGFDKVYISIHSSIPEVHDDITQVPGSWRQTVKGIKNALKYGIPLMTNTVIHGKNYKNIPDLVEFLAELGVREIELDFVRYIGNARRYFDEIKVSMSEVWPYLKKAFDVSKNYPIDMIYIDDYPLCLMPDYAEYNADSFGEGVHDEEAEHFAVEVPEGAPIHENEKMYLPQCKECVFRHKCQGIWKEYPELFGTDEFKPIKYT